MLLVVKVVSISLPETTLPKGIPQCNGPGSIPYDLRYSNITGSRMADLLPTAKLPEYTTFVVTSQCVGSSLSKYAVQ